MKESDVFDEQYEEIQELKAEIESLNNEVKELNDILDNIKEWAESASDNIDNILAEL